MAIKPPTPTTVYSPGEATTTRSEETRYVFKPASEMPPIKPDYVVVAPTPLGQRAVQKPQNERRK